MVERISFDSLPVSPSINIRWWLSLGFLILLGCFLCLGFHWSLCFCWGFSSRWTFSYDFPFLSVFLGLVYLVCRPWRPYTSSILIPWIDCSGGQVWFPCLLLGHAVFVPIPIGDFWSVFLLVKFVASFLLLGDLLSDSAIGCSLFALVACFSFSSFLFPFWGHYLEFDSVLMAKVSWVLGLPGVLPCLLVLYAHWHSVCVVQWLCRPLIGWPLVLGGRLHSLLFLGILVPCLPG